MLEPTKEEIERAKEPAMWDTLYGEMTPHEKGSWNAQQRKKGMDGKTATPLEDVKKKKPNEPVKIDFDLTPMHTAGLWSNIKNSSIYKLLDNPQVLGTELGHETIIEIINLLQNSGLLKKSGRVKKFNTN